MPSCYLCSSEESEKIVELRQKPEGETDFGIPPEKYLRTIYQCRNCSVYYSIHDLLSDEFYEGAYNEATYGDAILEKYTRIRNLPDGNSDNKLRARRVAGYLDECGKPREETRVLDIGSGLCVFLGEMKDKGFYCYCIDPDPVTIEHSLKNVGVDGGHVGTLDNFETDQRFDLVAFNKVLEHVEDSVGMLHQAGQYLAPGGAVYIELPDGNGALAADSLVAREEFFIEHFTIFNEASVGFLAQAAGMEIERMECIHEPSDKYTVYAFLKAV